MLFMNVRHKFIAICEGFAMSATNSSLFAMDSQCPSCIQWKYQYFQGASLSHAICKEFDMYFIVNAMASMGDRHHFPSTLLPMIWEGRVGMFRTS